MNKMKNTMKFRRFGGKTDQTDENTTLKKQQYGRSYFLICVISYK